jgi:RHS repeat-associated protein
LADSSGHLLEWYWYDLQGLPCILDAKLNQRTASAFGVRHLFTGQQWYQDIGLYDLRNRFYSPDIGRFLQPDPIGFRGGNNLYRYCRNNPVTRWDPLGLADDYGSPNEEELGRVTVTGEPVPVGFAPGGVLGGGYPRGGGSGEPGFGGRNNSDNPRDHLVLAPLEDIPIPLPPPIPEIPALESPSDTGDAASQALTVGGVVVTASDLAFSGGSVGTNLAYYSSGWRGNNSVETLQLGKLIKGAGAGVAAAQTFVDLNNLKRGDISTSRFLFGLGVTFYGAAGPMEAVNAAIFGPIEVFYPGGWLGNGSNVPYQGAGALSDYGYTIYLNRQIDPNWALKIPGPF